MIYFGYSVGFILVIGYHRLCMIYFGYSVGFILVIVGFILVIEYDLFWL